jgi:hypothetical protein
VVLLAEQQINRQKHRQHAVLHVEQVTNNLCCVFPGGVYLPGNLFKQTVKQEMPVEARNTIYETIFFFSVAHYR